MDGWVGWIHYPHDNILLTSSKFGKVLLCKRNIRTIELYGVQYNVIANQIL